jgi:uncharacterized membrane protein YeaQ/YmgE (transglycosylase-associated protein family)
MIITIIAGAVIGWIASMVMGTNASMGAIANIVCGLLGAVVGGFISNMVFGTPTGGAGFGLYQLLFGVIGACIVIAIAKALFGGGNRTITH